MRRFLFVALGCVLTLFFSHAPVQAATLTPGELIRSSQPAVYYYSSDGQRHAFPNEQIYFTWYTNFDPVVTVSDETLASIPLGANITHKPGARMVKIQTDPKVYAVARGGVLRWIVSEEVAKSIYGTDWNTLVQDLPDSFFPSYSIGTSILSANDFSPYSEFSNSQTIGYDLDLRRNLLAQKTDPPTTQNPTPVAPAVLPAPAPPSTPSTPPATQPSTTPTTPTVPSAPAFPTINPAYPLLTVHVQAVQVSNDDGSRAANINTDQVKRWVDKANEVYAQASVRLLFDPSTDFSSVRSSVLNAMAGNSDANWDLEVETGNKIAADHAGKLTVFFIHGPGTGPTGGAFSSLNYNFVEMPGFNDTSVCGSQNIGIMAHEVGHYLGLAHTFARTFASSTEAESFFAANGSTPAIFDGDGLSDTPPDPFIGLPANQCDPGPTITLKDQALQLPYLNIMSYYYSSGVDRTELTPQQIAIMRWVMGLRSKNDMSTPTNRNVPDAIEFETLPVHDQVNAATGVQNMSGFGDAPRWSGDRQSFTAASSDGLVEFSVFVSSTGRYRLDLYATTAPDYGSIQTLVDGNALGIPNDLYTRFVLPTGRLSVGTVDLTAGTHTLGFHVIGKNDASSGYLFGLDAFTLTPVQ